MQDRIPVAVVTGPVGVGKSSVAAAMSQLLDEAGEPHALVDLDALRWCHPSPAHDPFHIALGLRNLATVWANYHAAGAERLILVDIVEARDDLAGYASAIPGAAIVVVRLRASLQTIWGRLEGREFGSALAWHRQRAVELTKQMDETRVEDLLVDTESRRTDDIAREILVRTHWVAAPSASDT